MIFSNIIVLIGNESRIRLDHYKLNTADWDRNQEQGLMFSNTNTVDWEGDRVQSFYFSNLILMIGMRHTTRLGLLKPNIAVWHETQNKV